jgi:flagellar protein FliS
MSRHTYTASSAYRHADVQTASPKDLLVHLYQGLDRFLRAAQVAMRDHRALAAHVQCTKASNILVELMSTINPEVGGALPDQLRNLYAFLMQRVGEANLRKEPALIDDILPIIDTLRDGWQQVPEEHANLTSVPASNQGHAVNFRS